MGDELEEYIWDVLDLIEFANGDADSFWGARRAQMGHPEPFHLEYIGIGNEEVGEPFLNGTLFSIRRSGEISGDTDHWHQRPLCGRQGIRQRVAVRKRGGGRSGG